LNALKAYSQEIETGVCAHYPGRHISEWHQGVMSSRELMNMLAGMPVDSWFKASVREDMDELIGDATVQVQQDVKAKTEALLRGEVRLDGPVDVETVGDTNLEIPVRRLQRGNRINPQA
jgi:hypothetical protein